MEYMFFEWFTGENKKDACNTENLNNLLKEGWIPVRETTPSSPAGAGHTSAYHHYNLRIVLCLLQRPKKS